MFRIKRNNQEEQKIIDTIRVLGLDMINEAKSGHPGIVLGAAPIMYTLYAYHLNFNPDDPLWINRDRFVLSAGHGSALLYATLFMAGFNLKIANLKQFRSLNSNTPGHPEYLITPGVDATTGPLGQGIAMSVGMAIASKMLNSHYQSLINNYVYALVSDGDLMEGISYEAASVAGNLGLDNLIVLYDANDISLDGPLDKSFNEDVKMRFLAQNWQVLMVNDGEDIQSINDAINKAKTSDKPVLIIIKTVIGKHSTLEGTNLVHGAPLQTEDLNQIKEKLEKRDGNFVISSEDQQIFSDKITNRISNIYNKWLENREYIHPDDLLLLEKIEMGHLSLDNLDIDYDFEQITKEAPRDTSGKVLNDLANNNPFLVGGSADLSSSTKTYLKDLGDFNKKNYQGRNIWYGVREHAMGAISNGITLFGIRNFNSTFLTFADYLKPTIRLSALMRIPSVYIFTHDSILLGEDGPTHQPIEQLVMLRSIPNLEVIRPADVNEVIGTYKYIFSKEKDPSAVILARNALPILEGTNINDVAKGAYIVFEPIKDATSNIISTGEQLHTAVAVAKKLEEEGIYIRVISTPSIEVFEKQEQKYQDEILNKNLLTIVIEASSSYSWYKYVKDKEHLITIDTFGKSAKSDDLAKDFKFDYDQVLNKVKQLTKDLQK